MFYSPHSSDNFIYELLLILHFAEKKMEINVSFNLPG